jgi:hypothetical protein
MIYSKTRVHVDMCVDSRVFCVLSQTRRTCRALHFLSKALSIEHMPVQTYSNDLSHFEIKIDKHDQLAAEAQWRLCLCDLGSKKLLQVLMTWSPSCCSDSSAYDTFRLRVLVQCPFKM